MSIYRSHGLLSRTGARCTATACIVLINPSECNRKIILRVVSQRHIRITLDATVACAQCQPPPECIVGTDTEVCVVVVAITIIIVVIDVVEVGVPSNAVRESMVGTDTEQGGDKEIVNHRICFFRTARRV